MKIEARAKINLTLNVTGRRDNGYHDLELIFQPVSLCDPLYIEKKPDQSLAFSCSVKLFENEDNLVCKTYRAMAQRYPQIGGLSVFLKKRIPSGAGMAGGSTDAAAMIRALDQMYGLHMTWEQKKEIAVSLGADVAACLLTQASIGRGIGEELTKIDTDFTYSILVLKPKVSFSTAQMYRAIDESGQITQRYLSQEAAAGLETKDLDRICASLYNVFEEAIPEKAVIRELKQALTRSGAIGSLMTGSGSCVYGIYRNRRMRDRAYRMLKKHYQAYACEAVNRPQQ